MAYREEVRVAETSTTTGTGAFTVAGVVPGGYRTFAAAYSVGDTFHYLIEDSIGGWEIGIGTYSALNTITRTTVRRSSNANNAVNFTAGSKNVYVIRPEEAQGMANAEAKVTLVDADKMPLADSASSNDLKHITWANLKNNISPQQAGAAFDFNTVYPLNPEMRRIIWNTGNADMVNSPEGNTGGMLMASATAHDLWNGQFYLTHGTIPNVFIRGSVDGAGVRTWGNWYKVLTERNTSLTPGVIYTFRNTAGQTMNTATGSLGAVEIKNDTAGGDAFMTFHVSGDFAGYFGMAGDLNDFAVGGWSYGAFKYRVLHAGNLNVSYTWSGTQIFTAEQRFTASNGWRHKNGNDTTGYGVIFRNDDSMFYLLLTNNNDADGTWNALRPFYVNLNTGLVTFGNGFTASGTVTFNEAPILNKGIRTSGQAYPGYKLLLDFINDVANTWRKIVDVVCPNIQYSTIGFKITVTDPQSNHATTGSVDTVRTEIYYVNCVRTNATVLDDPDACYVRGPGDRIRAVKTAVGTYEIQIQNALQYREYLVEIEVYAVNGTHTVTYQNGTAGSAGTAQYNATVGTDMAIFDKIIAKNQFVSNVATGTAPMVIDSTTKVTNLNADRLDDVEGANYTRADLTSLGLTGNLSINSTCDTAAEWAALPVGYSRLFSNAIGTAGGLPTNNYYYVFKTANRDGSGGGAYIAIQHDTYEMFFGKADTSSVLPTWKKLWHADNDGAGSGMDADLFDGVDSDLFARRVAYTAAGLAGDTNYWAKLATFTTGTNEYKDANFIFAATVGGVAGAATAIISVLARSNGLNGNPTVSVQIIGGDTAGWIGNDSFKMVSGAWSTDMELWVQKKAAWGQLYLHLLSYTPVLGGGITITYSQNSAWQSTEPTGAVNNVKSAGLEYSGFTVWHSGNDGVSSGLDADLLEGQQGSYYQNASNLNAGTIPDARLPTRLGTTAVLTSDWNTANANGWYMESTAANSPEASGVWTLGHVEVHNSTPGWITQTVHAFATDSEGDTKTWRREQNNGTWGSWYRLYLSGLEQTARYTTRYVLTANTSTSGWMRLGTYTIGSYGGPVLEIRLHAHNGYNALSSQLQQSHIFFVPTGPGGAVDANGFAGVGTMYTFGESTGAPNSIKWKANAAGNTATSFELWINAGTYMDNSYYEVTCTPGTTWTHNQSAAGQADPGAASSTILPVSIVVPRISGQRTGPPVYYNSGTTNALNYANGQMQRWAPNTGAQTLSITGWLASGLLSELLIEGVNLGAATITWPTINWIKSDGTTTTTFSSNGVTLQSSGTDFVLLWTRDGGTTIYGKVTR